MGPNDQVLTIIRALEQLGIEYMLVGSYSSNLYGVPRATQDADLVVQLKGESVGAVARLIGPAFKLDPQLSFETTTSTTRYVISHPGSGFKIELFLLSQDAHDQERFARRMASTLAGHPVCVPTAEDVVITKLRWSKGGDRRKDVDDARNVLAVQQGTIDLDYIRGWTDRHGTRQLLEQLLAQIEAQKL